MNIPNQEHRKRSSGRVSEYEYDVSHTSILHRK